MNMTACEKSKNGVNQWVFQRVSNALIVLYGVFLLVCLLTGGNPGLLLEKYVWFKLYSLITLAFACANSVLAAWQIAGDYLKDEGVNKLFVKAAALLSAGFFVLGVMVIF